MAVEYAELISKTNYSFLIGASHAHELMETASEIRLSALGICDKNGVYGLPKAYRAYKERIKEGLSAAKLISGAEITIENRPPIVLLAQNRSGYGLMCRILTESHKNREKGQAYLSWGKFLDLIALPGYDALVALLVQGDPWKEDLEHDYWTLKQIFGDRVYFSLSRFLDGWDKVRTNRTKELAKRYSIPIVATNDVHYHMHDRKVLHDVVTAIRARVTLKEVGTRLLSNAERYLKTPEQMTELFKDLPEAIKNTIIIADSCSFSLNELRYRYPSEWLPEGETAQGHLIKNTFKGAQQRYPSGIPEDVRKQLDYELKLIEKMKFADYFLTIWEIIEFAKGKKILCQGRGSAANSIVCYCLGITAIDPVRMNLLFERFISVERGEPPDIDVDFEHERREEVIQHIYNKYGRDRAGMVAAVITYRSRSAKRDVLKVFNSESSEMTAKIVEAIYGFPRHLSIHTGGFTLSADPLIETVPIEPARMDGRTVIQWDKDDLDYVGLLKVDVLALGMLSALRKTLDYVGNLTLATIPPEDPKTYEMMRRADTVGVFQIESRAQMSMLPRLLPETFYDLVVEIAIIRPGPIVGKMINPFLKRRRGLEPVIFPDPRLEPILGRTLGIPLFQEQIMKMAVALAGFTAGEADELRRTIGKLRTQDSFHRMAQKLMTGLQKNGLPKAYAEQVFEQIQSFASYGFPESHSASFALLAYASAYLKCHHPAEFTCALLNSQPMGFYSCHTLVDDAKRHGVKILPIDPNLSTWDSNIESGAIRLGFRLVKGISVNEVNKIEAARKMTPFISLFDFVNRTVLRRDLFHRLAIGDVFSAFGCKQREAIWQILAYDLLFAGAGFTGPGNQLSLFGFGKVEENVIETFLPRLNYYDSVCADYSSYGLSVRGHPMHALRSKIKSLPANTISYARNLTSGSSIKVSGMVIVRQRPATASGMTFATLEDETGLLDLALYKQTYERFQDVFDSVPFVVVTGVLQRDGRAVSMLVSMVKPISVKFGLPTIAQRDFR